MYAGVPMIAPVRVSFASSAAATPKSTSFTSKGPFLPGPLPDEDHVGRLDVAVDDARGVRGGQRLAHVGRHGEALLQDERRPALALRDVLALEPLHRDVRLPLVELPERDDAHDAGVVQPREHAPLAPEARLLARVDAGQRDDLERHRLAAHLVLRAVDDADAAASDLALDDEPSGEGLGLRRRSCALLQADREHLDAVRARPLGPDEALRRVVLAQLGAGHAAGRRS